MSTKIKEDIPSVVPEEQVDLVCRVVVRIQLPQKVTPWLSSNCKWVAMWIEMFALLLLAQEFRLYNVLWYADGSITYQNIKVTYK